MTKPYHVLLVRVVSDGPWLIEFGDYDRDCVAFERDDLINGYQAFSRNRTKIITVASDTQAAIDEAVAALNA